MSYDVKSGKSLIRNNMLKKYLYYIEPGLFDKEKVNFLENKISDDLIKIGMVYDYTNTFKKGLTIKTNYSMLESGFNLYINLENSENAELLNMLKSLDERVIEFVRKSNVKVGTDVESIIFKKKYINTVQKNEPISIIDNVMDEVTHTMSEPHVGEKEEQINNDTIEINNLDEIIKDDNFTVEDKQTEEIGCNKLKLKFTTRKGVNFGRVIKYHSKSYMKTLNKYKSMTNYDELVNFSLIEFDNFMKKHFGYRRYTKMNEAKYILVPEIYYSVSKNSYYFVMRILRMEIKNKKSQNNSIIDAEEEIIANVYVDQISI